MTIPRLQYLVGPHNNIQKKFELSTTRPDIIRAFLALFAKALYERSKYEHEKFKFLFRKY